MENLWSQNRVYLGIWLVNISPTPVLPTVTASPANFSNFAELHHAQSWVKKRQAKLQNEEKCIKISKITFACFDKFYLLSELRIQIVLF